MGPGFALVDFPDPLNPQAPRERLAFCAPRERLVAWALGDVPKVLAAAEQAALDGAWCVGYVRYEAAAAFDAALITHAAEGPLAWFAVYDRAEAWPEEPQSTSEFKLSWGDTALPKAVFDAGMAEILRAIAAGECYQVNYTGRLQGSLAGGVPHPEAALGVFAALRRAQPAGYVGYLDTGEEQLMSVSPELFFDWRERALLTRPMKGTAPRGRSPAQDAEQADGLRNSPKERAENVMIVDLLRNDVSRIAESFSVRVPKMMAVEALPTVWQMTSDVSAVTRQGVGLAAIFGALFPCGSVTGAPKVRAMQTIRALEPSPRGVYCGAFGIVRPGGSATFNVPIRTVVLRGDQATCGIGSGITADASIEGEWLEWQHKQAFLVRASQPFQLLETLRMVAGQVPAGPAHLARMASGAAHFGFPWAMEDAAAGLRELAHRHPQGEWRVRLLLHADGQLHMEADAVPVRLERVHLQLDARVFDMAHSEFVRHKTTLRAHYDRRAPAPGQGVFDTILWNARGQLTECTRGNIAVKLDGQWLTPPVSCGLLAGIGRAQALQSGRVEEAVVELADVPRIQAWAFLNSLRGWVDAELVGLSALTGGVAGKVFKQGWMEGKTT